MGKLDNELASLLRSMDRGGFGDPEAREQYQREIDHLKFQITRRDNMRVAIVSAVIGAVVAAVTTLLVQMVG
ncbi:hypothetical protein LNKW23_02100 [Paralimibaculum aggregatum]|uniref:DUF1640 domain-containing protein n=1 Tax=Paralimibaculum aggregatum TaxID=3036245 RepID=A0ABQ6LIK1_9RHOB|nr:hypothetical protein LNKW23_02100 [Limibaculum sp. NKW23]